MGEGYLSDITEESKKNGEIHRELFSPMLLRECSKRRVSFFVWRFSDLIKK